MIALLIVKVSCAVFLIYSLNISTSGTFWSNPTSTFDWSQNQILLTKFNGSQNWPLIFHGWDSAWYLSIMTKGYAVSAQSYTFSPALPFMGYLTNLILQNPLMSIAMVSLFFGILLIPLFQLLAENFVNKKTALLSTLLFAFFPYVFVFTTVAYSESLMLFLVIAAWLLASKGKIAEASVFGVLAPLSRTMGILVIIPLLYNSIKNKNRRKRNTFLSLLPIISLSSWFVYLGTISGVPLAPVTTTEWSQLWTFRSLILDGIPRYGLEIIGEAAYQVPPITTHWLLPSAVLIFLLFPFIILIKFIKKDKSLWLFAAFGYLGVLFFGALVSIPRFISMIFPLWIILFSNLKGDRKSIIVTIVLTTVFIIVLINLWQAFLRGEFIS